jgi:hypothetical protein
MNARIDKLIEQCTVQNFSDCTGGFETFDKEKFAELIIREYSYDVMDLTAAPEHVAMAARHWGVEL